VFYDRVPLNTYAFRGYLQQTVTTYDGHGNIMDGLRFFENTTATDPPSPFTFISQKNQSANFAPYSLAWNVQTEKAVSESTPRTCRKTLAVSTGRCNTI
jgi:hypothetical protein